MKIFDKFLGWADPLKSRHDQHAQAQALGHRDPHDGCLPWLQGRCPGLEQCPDCTWKEGTSRQQD
jgi:hypothetical protein